MNEPLGDMVSMTGEEPTLDELITALSKVPDVRAQLREANSQCATRSKEIQALHTQIGQLKTKVESVEEENRLLKGKLKTAEDNVVESGKTATRKEASNKLLGQEIIRPDMDMTASKINSSKLRQREMS